MKVLAQNVNALLVLAGFVALEIGVAALSGAAAWIAGGVILMAAGGWPYIVQTLRKRNP